MSRLKLTAMAALLAIPLAACNEGTTAPPQGSIEGQVSIEGQGVAGVTVSLSNGTSQTTGSDGRFAFAGIDGGTYTVSISGFAADATFANTSQPATISSQGQTVTVNFAGTYVRTASIIGTVTIEGGNPQGGLAVRLSGMADASTTTDASGQYAFTGLRAGAYDVEISGFDADAVGFSSTSKGTTVGVGETEVLSFDGTYLRTAGIVGRVAIEGDGLAGVTVSLSGSESRTATTDQAGQYAFNELRAGTYQVGISGFDADDYEFASTSKSVTVALGRTENVPFDGTLLRTAGISGRVSVEGMALAGVKVMLSGAATDSAMTTADGQYAFTGLAAGAYMVAISGYDMDAYAFDPASMSVTLADDESNITNFMGAHTRSANVWGYLYLDANDNDKYDGEAIEDMLARAGMPVLLQGPGVGDVTTVLTDTMGMYKFDGLTTGDYRVLNATPDTALARMGLAFGGLQTGMQLNVKPGSANAVHLPFDIKRQMITVSAMMGNGKTGEDRMTGAAVEGVEVKLYPTYQAANSGTNMLGMATTDSTGTATFSFMRAADVGPGGTTDYLVFAMAGDLPSDDFAVSSNAIQEVRYPARSQMAAAEQTITLLNRRARISYRVMSITSEALTTAKVMQGWATEVRYDTTHSGTMSPKASNRAGMVVFADGVAADDLPVTYYVNVTANQADTQDGGESFKATPMASDAAEVVSGYLAYEHDGLSLPGDTVYLGQLDIKFTTQSLVVGFHHEADQIRGFTGSGLTSADARPSASARQDVMVTLMTIDEDTGNPTQWNYPDGARPTGGTSTSRHPTAAGIVEFHGLPTDMYFTVKAEFEGVADARPRQYVTDTELETYYADGRFAERQDKNNRGAHSVGAFGPEGGTGHEVRLCPLSQAAKPANAPDNCSTFAYSLADGMLSGTVESDGGTYAAGVVVTLAPTALAAESDTRVDTVAAADSGDFSFEDVKAGRYTVSVAATDMWAPKPNLGSQSLTFVSNDGARDEDSGFTNTHDFKLVYQKTSILGQVANDDSNPGVSAGIEAESGVVVQLRNADARGRAGAIRTTTTTDARGRYAFEDLPEGTYFVQGVSTDTYDVFARHTPPVNQPTTPKLEATSLAISTSAEDKVVARTAQAPRFSAHLGTVTNRGSNANLLLLHKRGRITITAQAPDDTNLDANGVGDADGDPDPYEGLTYVLERCLTSDFSQWNTGTTCNAGSGGAVDQSFTPVRIETNEDGEVVFDNIRVGVYRVFANPAGLNVTATGTPLYFIGTTGREHAFISTVTPN